MTPEERDNARIDELLRAHAHAPAPAVAADVMRRLERPPRSLAFLRPLALATAAAVLLVGGGAVAGYLAGAHHAPTQGVPLASNVRTVHFALTAPGARSVVLVGDFNGWAPEAGTTLVRDGDRFMATLELPPGRYAYAFVVDGQEVRSDPDAPASEPDGFGGRNSVLEL